MAMDTGTLSDIQNLANQFSYEIDLISSAITRVNDINNQLNKILEFHRK